MRDLIDIRSLNVPIIDFFLQTQSSIRKIHANLKIFLKMSWSELFFTHLKKNQKKNHFAHVQIAQKYWLFNALQSIIFNCNSWSYTYVSQWYMYISSNVIVYKHFVLNTCSSYAVVDSFV